MKEIAASFLSRRRSIGTTPGALMRMIRYLIPFLSLCLSGCLFPAGWYNTGIETRLTVDAVPQELIEQIHHVITVNGGYEYLRERNGPFGELVRDY